jgi:hypothetical protein
MRSRTIFVALLAMTGLLAAPAWGWSELGHRIVGDLAELQLEPATRDAVHALLEGEREPNLGGVAAWADALRREDPQRFRISQRWHFINASGGGCRFDERRDCPGGDCITAAINAQRRILADPSLPRGQRRDALKFIVHFVGDVHQPLHAGPREDRGGNGYQVTITPDAQAQGRRNARPVGTNMHTLWDSQVLQSAGLTRRQYVAQLREREPVRAGAVDDNAPLRWARESCELVEARGLYPDGHAVDAAWVAGHRALAEERLLLAAARLAALLESALGTR